MITLITDATREELGSMPKLMPKLVLKNRCLSFARLQTDQPSPTKNQSELAKSHQMSGTTKTDPTLCYLWKGSKTWLHPCLSGNCIHA